LAAGKRTAVAYNSDIVSESFKFSKLQYVFFSLLGTSI